MLLQNFVYNPFVDKQGTLASRIVDKKSWIFSVNLKNF